MRERGRKRGRERERGVCCESVCEWEVERGTSVEIKERGRESVDETPGSGREREREAREEEGGAEEEERERERESGSD